MNIPKYWARAIETVRNPAGKTATFSCWQWSDVSAIDAKQKASARAETLAWKLVNKEKLERYGYGARPMREEICEGITNRKRNELGIVTRNGYGALILNAVNVMFIDIDFAPEKSGRQGGGLRGIIQRLLGQAPEPQPMSQTEHHLQNIEQWAASHQVGMRVYRTFAGLRCLVTNEVFDPTRQGSLDIMRELQCDPLYVKLCQSQACFRARLTPKPWRCGVRNPPSRYPWPNQAGEQKYRQWQNTYTQAASAFAVCRLVTQLGSSRVHPDVKPILDFHDNVACSGSDLRLA